MEKMAAKKVKGNNTELPETSNAPPDNGSLLWIYQFEQPKKSHRCIERTYRYVLGAFREYPPDPHKVLICIGLNPNTGIPGQLEKTVQAINDFAFNVKDYDGWIMLNLSPIRCGNSNDLPTAENLKELPEIDKRVQKRNIKIIKSILDTYPYAVIIAAWGDYVDKAKYLKDTAKEIYNYSCLQHKNSWYCCCLPSDRTTPPEKATEEELKNIQKGLTGKGNPRHPFRRWGASWGKQLDEALAFEFKMEQEP